MGLAGGYRVGHQVFPREIQQLLHLQAILLARPRAIAPVSGISGRVFRLIPLRAGIQLGSSAFRPAARMGRLAGMAGRAIPVPLVGRPGASVREAGAYLHLLVLCA